MHSKKIITLSFIFTHLFCNQTMASTLARADNDEAYLKTWVRQIDNVIYHLEITRNPIGSEYPFHVKYNNPHEGYVSDKCQTHYAEMVCGFYSAPGFFARLVLNDAQHKITVSTMAGWEFDYFEGK